MSIQEQVVAFPIVGGVDEASHPRLCARLLTMRNCRQMKNGSVGKRFGTVRTGLYNARLSGGTPPTGELLTCLGDELVRVGRGQVDSVKAIGSTDCIFKGRASEALVYRRQFTNGESYVVDSDVAFVNGYQVLTYTSGRVTATGTIQSTRVAFTVVDGEGATIFADRTLDSFAGATPKVQNPHVVAIGNLAIFVWTNGTAIKGRTLDLTTMTLGAIVTLVAGPITLSFPAVCVIGTTLVVAWQDGATGIMVASFSTALASVVAPAVAVAYTAAVTGLALEGLTGASLYLGYYDTAGANKRIRGVVLNPATLAVTTAAFNVDASTILSAWLVVRLSITLVSGGASAIYAWTAASFSGSNVTDSRTAWTPVSNVGVIGNGASTKWLSLASKPWFDNGELYALVRTIHSTHGTLFVAGLYLGTTSPQVTNGMRLVATVAPRQTPRSAFIYGNGLVSSVVATASGRYITSAIVSGALPDSFVVSVLDIRMGGTKPNAIEVGGLLILAGGAPSVYDGSTVAELGFAYEPDSNNMTATLTAGGNMTPSKTYYYLAVYEYRFANGSVVRSIPGYPYGFDGTDLSKLLKVVTTLTDLSADVKLSDITLTNKSFFDPFSEKLYPISIVLYRTEGDGAVFYRVTPVQVTTEYQNWTAYQGATISDTLDDATLRQRPQIYTTGGQLPSEIPPSAAHVSLIQQRVFFSSTDDDTIWFSDVIVDGEAPAFSGSKAIAPFGGGRVVGMAPMDEKYVVLKDKSLWYFTGDGPNVNGTDGTFSWPVPIASDLGCIERSSIVSTPQGVMFQSQNGLALLARDLTVSLIGKAVEDTVAGRSVVAACVVPNQELVRFAVDGTDVVEWDMFHGGAWGTSSYGASNIVSACFCRGSWWFLDAAGIVTRETTTDWTDSGAFVESNIRLRYLSLGDLQGFARVWFVSLDGERRSDFDLMMSLHVDEDDSTTQTETWTASETTEWTRLQAQIHVERQECEALSIEISDSAPSDAGVIGTGEGLVVFGVSAEVGLDKAMRRVPTAQTK